MVMVRFHSISSLKYSIRKESWTLRNGRLNLHQKQAISREELKKLKKGGLNLPL